MFSSKKYPSQLSKTLALAVLLALPQAAHSFVFTIDNNTDAADSIPGDGICATAGNACTLRAAIQEANAWPGTDNIILPANTYTLSLAGSDDTASLGDLDITDNLTLHGAGSDTTIIDAGGIDKALHILSSATASITGITIQNGSSSLPGGGISNTGILSLGNTVISSNTTTSAINGGGGIYNEGILSLDNVTLDTNNASAGIGGGIYNGSASSTISITNSTINNNTALNSGGGIYINAGTITITDSAISNNNVETQHGGGVYNGGGNLTINSSTINNNQSYRGNGIHNGTAGLSTLTITSSTISNNSTPSNYPRSGGTPSTSGEGGGLYLAGSSAVTISNSTIASNSAKLEGAGLSNNGSNISISNTIISNNKVDPAGANSLQNCILNTGSLTSTGYNLADDGSCTLNNANDIQTTPGNISLATTLANNGGPTQTLLLASTSPFGINSGVCIAGSKDQRGVTRASSCDRGAYEDTASDPSWADMDLHLEQYPNPVIASNSLDIKLTATNLGPATASGASITALVPTGLTYTADDSAITTTSYTPGSGLWSAANFAALQSKRLTITSTVDSPSTSATVNSTATTATDLNAGNDSANHTVNIATQTDISIATSIWINGVTATEVVADQPFNYQFDATNSSTAIARNVLLSVNLPAADISFTTPAGCSYNAGLLTCSLGDINPSAATSITLSATPTKANITLNTTARLNFYGIDTTTTDNTDIVNVPAIPKTVDMGASIIASASTVVEGNDISYIVTATNHGPDNASGVEMTITLPPTTAAILNTYISDKDNQGNSLFTCVGTPMVCTLNESREILASGESASITFLFTTIDNTPSANTLFDISASITSTLATDNTASNDSVTLTTTATESIIPIAETDLNLTLTAGPETIYVGDPVTVTATAEYLDSSNGTPLAATGISISFNLPNTVTLQTSTLPQECTAAGSIVTCDWSSATIWPNGAVSSRIIITPDTDAAISINASTVNNDGTDPDPNNNTMTIAVSITPDTGFRPQAGSGCFIATAAYGSYLDSHVMTLRHFRDNVLLTNALGTQLVNFYYQTSPPIAAYISEHDTLRALTRWGLTPLVYSVEYPLPSTLLGLLLISGTIGWRRRAGQRK